MEFFILSMFSLFSVVLSSFFIASDYRNWKNLSKRSCCNNCKKEIDYIRLIPIFGSLLSGFKCNHCNEKYSWKMSFMEFLSIPLFFIIFKLSGIDFSSSLFILKIILISISTSLLILFSYEDWETHYISDIYIIIGISLLIYPFINNFSNWIYSIGFIFLFKIILDNIFSFIRNEDTTALGEGDILLFSIYPLLFKINNISDFKLMIYFILVMSISSLIMSLITKSRIIPMGPNFLFAIIIIGYLKVFIGI
jgi:prepilin signal peptidase PulO-like enzyme (type II secretory pathway)